MTMPLTLLRYVVKADAKMNFVLVDTIGNQTLDVTYRNVESAFKRCDSLNQVPIGTTAKYQQAKGTGVGTQPATRLLNVYSQIHNLYSAICTSPDGLAFLREKRTEYEALLSDYVSLSATQFLNKLSSDTYLGKDPFTIQGEGYRLLVSGKSGEVLEANVEGITKPGVQEMLRSIERFDIREMAEWFSSFSNGDFALKGQTLDARAIGYWPKEDAPYVPADEGFREDALERRAAHQMRRPG